MGKYDSQNRFNKANTKQVVLRLNIRTDADILARLDSLNESKLGYVKRLIREDIARNATTEPTE